MSQDGGEDTSFSILSKEEALKLGVLEVILGMSRGKVYYKMNVSENIYDSYGKLLCFGRLKVKS